MLTDPVSDADVWAGYRQEDDEVETEDTPEEAAGPCWEAGNPSCTIRQALDAAAEEEPAAAEEPEPEPEESAVDMERLLSITRGINQKLRGA
jgi:hypothetical protein